MENTDPQHIPVGHQQQAAETYFQTQVKTTPKDQLLLLVFDGALRHVNKAREALRRQDFETKHESLVKVQAALAALSNSLSPDIGEALYKDIRGLYFYVYRNLIEANLENSLEKLDDAIGILEHVRETWREAVGKYREEIGNAAGGDEEPEGGGLKGISVSG